MVKVGERVGAIISQNKNELRLAGYGVYEGDFVPKEAIGFMAQLMAKNNRTNPRIRLDNNKIVYGCECWWASETEIKQQVEEASKLGVRVISVDIDAIRNEK